MSGLVGIVSTDRREQVEAKDIDSLASAYESLRGSGRRASATAGTFARVVALAGTKDDAVRVEGSASRWSAVVGVTHGPDIALQPAPEDLDGHFALVEWREDVGELVVATDAFAMQALYVAERGTKTYFSTCALALAKFLRARPSRFALLAYLRSGYHFGALTHWEGIERLEPATSLTFTPERVSRRVYWRPTIDVDIARLSLPETADACLETAVDTYADYFARAAAPWSDLTGGYDTRLLNLLLGRAGIDFATDTRGDEEGPDLRIARQVAELTGWEWSELKLPSDWERVLPGVLPVALAWGDGQLDVLELSWVLWAHGQLSQERRRLLYAGGGEHFRDFTWRQEFLRQGRSNRVNLDNWLDMRMLNPMRTALFAEDPTGSVRSDFARRMTRWAEPYADELNTTQLDVMYAYKVTGHFAMYRSADGAFLDAELPFYFKPVFTAAFSSNFSHRNRHRLMQELVWRLDRRVAGVATSAGGPAEPKRVGNLHRFVPYYVQLGHRAINKVTEKAVGRAFLPPVETYDWWCPTGARGVVLDMLESRNNGRFDALRARALFDQEELARFFTEARSDGFREVSVLGRIATVELVLRATDASLDA